MLKRASSARRGALAVASWRSGCGVPQCHQPLDRAAKRPRNRRFRSARQAVSVAGREPAERRASAEQADRTRFAASWPHRPAVRSPTSWPKAAQCAAPASRPAPAAGPRDRPAPGPPESPKPPAADREPGRLKPLGTLLGRYRPATRRPGEGPFLRPAAGDSEYGRQRALAESSSARHLRAKFTPAHARRHRSCRRPLLGVRPVTPLRCQLVPQCASGHGERRSSPAAASVTDGRRCSAIGSRPRPWPAQPPPLRSGLRFPCRADGTSVRPAFRPRTACAGSRWLRRP